MKPEPLIAAHNSLLRTLAEFRFELRCFFQFSEFAALEAGLQPQQHQLLLQVAGAHEAAVVTIAYAAERLGLKHNSAVELVNRLARSGYGRRHRTTGLPPPFFFNFVSSESCKDAYSPPARAAQGRAL